MKQVLDTDGKTHIVTLDDGDQIKLVTPDGKGDFVYIVYKDGKLTYNSRQTLD